MCESCLLGMGPGSLPLLSEEGVRWSPLPRRCCQWRPLAFGEFLLRSTDLSYLLVACGLGLVGRKGGVLEGGSLGPV